MGGNAHNYEGTLDLQQITAGWIEGTRRGLSIQDVRTVWPGNEFGREKSLNAAMEFDHVIYSFGDGRIADVVGIWAPDVMGYTEVDEHGEPTSWRIGEIALPWYPMRGYSAQQGGSPDGWMHASEFVGGTMARDILATPGFYVVVCPSWDMDQEPTEWAVLYISEHIPGII
jgi:hypothetical protein